MPDAAEVEVLCSGEFEPPGVVATPVVRGTDGKRALELYTGTLEVAPIAPFDFPLVADSELEGKLRVEVWLRGLPYPAGWLPAPFPP